MWVGQVTSAYVVAVLLPIWSTKRETARRERQRVRTIMKCGDEGLPPALERFGLPVLGC